MVAFTYLVFGDLHGRILPAFRLASAWAREHSTSVDGLLQVGDLGFFPDPGRLDKATKRHAEKDFLEMGTLDVVRPSRLADEVFADPDAPPALWFIAGNHEDYEALDLYAHGGDRTSYPVDDYLRVRCLRDGTVTTLPGGLRVGGLWGIDDQAPHARKRVPPRAYIRSRAATQLAGQSFDVLLTHESPRDAVYIGSGSLEIDAVLGLTRPGFLFFGHYAGTGHRVPDFGATAAYHLSGLELRGRDGTAEDCSVGVLRWQEGKGSFEYLSPMWLRTFTRHNWRSR
jgi:hypothetical protein